MADDPMSAPSFSPSPEPRRARNRPPPQVAVGLGDPERDQRLLPPLDESHEFVIVERCLAADELLTLLRQRPIDVALVAFDLHRLSRAMLTELQATHVPMVLLAYNPNEEPWASFVGIVLPLDADADTVREALLAAAHGERRPTMSEEDERQPVVSEDGEPTAASGRQINRTGPLTDDEALGIIAVASGHGSPGRTMLATNIAAALGAAAPTILVDADLSGPSIALHLDLDPTRNLYMLAHAEPQSPREWDYAIAQEVQPLAARSGQAHVLCGLPKADLRSLLTPQFCERLLHELHLRYRYVVLDIGADFIGPDVALHHVAIGLAEQVLLVTASDMAGLWHGRAALGRLQTKLSVPTDRIALVLNRHDRRLHHRRTEIEWTLRTPTAAVIPYDYRAAQRAVLQQRPLIHVSRGRASRALLDLADRIHGERIILPPEATDRRWPRWPTIPRWRRSRPAGGSPTLEREMNHGDEPDLVLHPAQPDPKRANGRARPARRSQNGRQPPAG